jgi:MFS family permease
MREGDFFGALRERQFRLLWLGQATSTLGDGLVPVALAFAVIQSLDRGPTALGIVLAAEALPLVVFVLAGGVWADRLPRQMVMLVSDVVRGTVQAALAILLLTGTAEVWRRQGSYRRRSARSGSNRRMRSSVSRGALPSSSGLPWQV